MAAIKEYWIRKAERMWKLDFRYEKLSNTEVQCNHGDIFYIQNYLVLLNEGSITLTLHYCMILKVCCNSLMVNFMSIKFVSNTWFYSQSII